MSSHDSKDNAQKAIMSEANLTADPLSGQVEKKCEERALALAKAHPAEYLVPSGPTVEDIQLLNRLEDRTIELRNNLQETIGQLIYHQAEYHRYASVLAQRISGKDPFQAIAELAAAQRKIEKYEEGPIRKRPVD